MSNPTELLVAPTIRNAQPKPIADDDWLALYDVADDVERIVLGLGLYGGLRRHEMTALRVLHVDHARLRLVGFMRKGGGDDVLPLATMLEVFERRLSHLYKPDFEVGLRGLASEREGTSYLLPWADTITATARSRRLGGLADDQLDPQHLNRVMTRLCARAGEPRYKPRALARARSRLGR